VSGFTFRLVGLDRVQRAVQALDMQKELPNLMRSLSAALSRDVKDRIKTQDDGRWDPLSKWGQAKTGQSKALLGTEQYIHARSDKDTIRITGDAPGWSFDDHNKGFTNQLVGPGDETSGQHVVLRLKSPEALGLKSSRSIFMFVPKPPPGKTPARKIWPTRAEATETMTPIAERWMERLLAKVQNV
jgi:hypothetical protein